MNVTMENTFLTDVNRMFDSHPLYREEDREKFVSRAQQLKSAGVDITKTAIETGNFFKEFMDVSMSVNDHPKWVEDLSRKYTDLCDALAGKYKDDEDELYRMMGKLNEAFQGALNSTCLMPLYPVDTSRYKLRAVATDEEWTQIQDEYAAYERHDKNVRDFMRNLENNMQRYVNSYFESFISSIRTNDFEIAYSESMALLENSETTSDTKISYKDLLKIKDVLTNLPTEFDEKGAPTKYRYSSAEQAFRALVRDDNISYSLRKAIADIFSFYIKPPEEESTLIEEENLASNDAATTS